VQSEYFAVVCGGLYVEMHDTRKVGQPLHREIVPSCLTADMAYAAYLQQELRRWDGVDAEIVRVDLTATLLPK
jgi:hypothetical protein